MSDTITLSCLHCGAEITFQVESWAKAPERAFCGRSCYQAATGQSAEPETAVATS